MAQCSNCAASDDLHVVTLGAPGSQAPARLAVLCPACRERDGARIDISWPLRLLTPGTFLELYRLGRTESDPRMAVHAVFGAGHDWVSTEAADILERRRLGD